VSETKYCSKKCQQKDWIAHSIECTHQIGVKQKRKLEGSTTKREPYTKRQWNREIVKKIKENQDSSDTEILAIFDKIFDEIEQDADSQQVDFLITDDVLNLQVEDEEKTPLTAAAYHNFYILIVKFISKGADVKQKDGHQKRALDYAAKGGNVRIIDRLVTEKKGMVFERNLIDGERQTALDLAVIADQPDAIEELLRLVPPGAKSREYLGRAFFSIYELQTDYGDSEEEIGVQLVNAGVDPTFVYTFQGNPSRRNIYQISVLWNLVRVVKRMMEFRNMKFSLPQRRRLGKLDEKTLLRWKLVSQYQNLDINIRDHNRRTVMWFPAQEEEDTFDIDYRLQMVDALLNAKNFNLAARDDFGETVFFHTLEPEIVAKLVNYLKNAETLNIRSHDVNGEKTAVQELIARLAPSFQGVVSENRENVPKILEHARKIVASVRLLLSKDPNVDSQDDLGWTTLMWAIFVAGTNFSKNSLAPDYGIPFTFVIDLASQLIRMIMPRSNLSYVDNKQKTALGHVFNEDFYNIFEAFEKEQEDVASVIHFFTLFLSQIEEKKIDLNAHIMDAPKRTTALMGLIGAPTEFVGRAIEYQISLQKSMDAQDAEGNTALMFLVLNPQKFSDVYEILQKADNVAEFVGLTKKRRENGKTALDIAREVDRATYNLLLEWQQ